MAESLKFHDIKLEGGKLIISPAKEDMGKAMTLVRSHKKSCTCWR